MPRPSTSVGRKRLCSAASRALTERCPSIQVQKKPWRTRWIPSFRISVEFRFVEFSQSSFECPCPPKDVATAPAVQSRRSFFWNYPIRSFFPARKKSMSLMCAMFYHRVPIPLQDDISSLNQPIGTVLGLGLIYRLRRCGAHLCSFHWVVSLWLTFCPW